MSIPTAEEFIIANKERFQSLSADVWLVEFAKLHVQAALESAKKETNLKWVAGESGVLKSEDLELIYPLNKIK